MEMSEHPIPSGGIGYFKIRLKQAISSQSLRGFAKDCGLSEATLRSYLSGETFPTLDRLEQIAKAAGASPLWLAFGGEGPAESRSAEDDEYAYIPLYDARVSAGHGSWTEGARVLAQLAFTRYSLRKKGLDPANLSAIRVSGDSNEPDLRDGDTVVLDHSRTEVDQEGYYVILLGDHLFAKRLQLQIGGGMAVISANPAYQTMMVAKEHLSDLVIIGRVVWGSRWMA
ncbi:S24 family peptidase [Pseudomonas sp. CAN2814]|uniref:LexA family transcriptional regulator n=1 Tax=Pseudomonas sp. CAN1 TaxID=3046726 RepID=UPI002648FC7D|nr:S24 family peptidase [Pseudomonas sp. CAN1]MDN6854956.1 S24 family peptidase [Pseudomonas sp. CAN1]